MLVSGSILSDKPKYYAKEFDKTRLDYIHLDIMDGKFTKEKTYTFGEIKDITKDIGKKLDVHLMVKNPMKYIDDYALLNVEYITFHYEAVKNPREIIDYIKNMGIKVGMSISPKTKVNVLFPYLEDLDLVLVMSVEPGRSGQEFKESILYKIEVLKKKIEEMNVSAIIEVDGGINSETALLVSGYKADIVVSASYIQKDLNNIDLLKSI